MNNVLAKEEVLMDTKNDHFVAAREYGNCNPVVKGVVSGISGNPTHSNQDLFPKPINIPDKKQRHRKRSKLLQDASGINSTFNSSVNNDRNLEYYWLVTSILS